MKQVTVAMFISFAIAFNYPVNEDFLRSNDGFVTTLVEIINKDEFHADIKSEIIAYNDSQIASIEVNEFVEDLM